LSRKELDAFENTLRHDFYSVMTNLCKINLERCECFVKEDKDRIFAAVRSLPGGLDAFNNAVMKLIREWVNKAAKQMVLHVSVGKETKTELDDLVSTALLLTEQGDYVSAKVLYERALRGYEKLFGLEHARTLNTLHLIGNYHRDIGEFAEADSIYSRVLSGLEKLGDPSRYLALYNIGILRREQGRKDDAVSLLTQGRDGLVSVFGPDSYYSKDAEKALAEITST
jgi:tetratricopeptide (TPR) repeat protein